jgi:hypothetical protein
MVSLLLRRAHMYLALFLFPWMLMYALSTLAMNHRRAFAPPAVFEKERELVYDGVLPGELPAARRLRAAPRIGRPERRAQRDATRRART